MPYPYKSLSVFQIQGLPDDEIRRILQKSIFRSQINILYGRADVFTSIVEELGLKVEHDNNPPQCANIVGWPEEKSARMLLAIEMAKRTNLKLQ